MFCRQEVKKRGMDLLKGNSLFFFVMILVTIGLGILPFLGIFSTIIVRYFLVKRSLSIYAGKESKWFDFESNSFGTVLIQYLIICGISCVAIVSLIILIFIFAFIPYINVFLIVILLIASLVAFVVISLTVLFADYIAIEYPKVGAWNALILSYKITKDHLNDLFVFSLSFILWYLLIFITCGIATFYVNGYIVLSTTCLYNEFKSKSPLFSKEIAKYGYLD